MPYGRSSIPRLNQLKVIPARPATARLQAMEFGDRSRRTDIAEDRNAIAREGMGLRREAFEFEKMKQNLAMTRDYMPTLKPMEMDQFKNHLRNIGVDSTLIDMLPSSQQAIDMPQDEFKQVSYRATVGMDKVLESEKQQYDFMVDEVKRAQKLQDDKELARYKSTLDKENGGKNLSEMQLTRKALSGDEEAKKILEAMTSRKIEVGKAAAQGKIEGLYQNIDIEGTAEAVLQGRETIENVKNTFGVPIQEAVRKAVLVKDSEFNFLLPRAVVRSIDTSLKAQEKQRGLMGSFVRNINKQVSRVDEIVQEVDRWGVRALDLPKRELITRLKGSGKEKVLEAYLTEISAEIGKLSTGSSASIRELSTEGQARWNKIHDPNLSLGELKIILEETRDMADMRISSTNEEIEFTKERLENLKSGSSSTLQRSVSQPQKPPSQFEIISVED